MVEVREREPDVARDPYAAAYAPARSARTLEVLEEQRGLLGAADALEQRAGTIDEWPITRGRSPA